MAFDTRAFRGGKVSWKWKNADYFIVFDLHPE
jgi:hypothetical protein